MQLSARILADAVTVNSFRYATEQTINSGDAGFFAFQLVDLDQLLAQHGYNLPGLRYIPAAGATLTVQFQNIDAARQFTRAGSMPFAADDRSIWRVPLLASDPLDGTQSLKITLTEGSTIRSFFLSGALRVRSTNLCGC